MADRDRSGMGFAAALIAAAIAGGAFTLILANIYVSRQAAQIEQGAAQAIQAQQEA